jgi:bacterioferritin-associated ferredoxin
MKGCACHDVTFAEIARRMGLEGLSFEALRRILPCGRTCTACLPDLAEYLRRRGLPLSS